MQVPGGEQIWIGNSLRQKRAEGNAECELHVSSTVQNRALSISNRSRGRDNWAHGHNHLGLALTQSIAQCTNLPGEAQHTTTTYIQEQASSWSDYRRSTSCRKGKSFSKGAYEPIINYREWLDLYLWCIVFNNGEAWFWWALCMNMWV